MNRRNFIRLSAVAASLTAARGAGEPPVGDPEGKPILSFGMITDVQYADADPEGERHYRASIPKLKTAVEFLAKKNLPFTLHLGDLIDRDFQSFDAVLPLLDGLGHPVHHLLGNHDYSVTDGEKSQIVAKLGMPHDYFSFVQSGVRFVMIDTNDRSTYKYPKDSQQDQDGQAFLKKLISGKAISAKPWNGGVSDAQLAWLDGELTAAAAAKERVVLCGHHPLQPADGYQAWNGGDLLAMIDKHSCIVAYFCGHNHAGAESMRNGIPYITFKSILHEPEANAFSVIHLFGDRLEIEGCGREVSRVIPLKVIAA
ncbi:MAG: metallophosphoesterase [Luteolibacter sp.]